MSESELKRYRLLYEVSKDEYKIELDRNKLLDDKASKYSSLSGFIIMGYTMGIIRLNSILQYACDHWSQMVIYLLCVIVFITIVVSWYYLSKVINRHIMEGVSFTEHELHNVFGSKDEVSCLKYMAETYQTLILQNRMTIQEKTKILNIAYRAMCWSAIVFMILFLFVDGLYITGICSAAHYF